MKEIHIHHNKRNILSIKKYLINYNKRDTLSVIAETENQKNLEKILFGWKDAVKQGSLVVYRLKLHGQK